VNRISSKLRGLPLGEIGSGQLVRARPFKVLAFEKPAIRPLILVIPISGFHIDLDELEDEATPYFTRAQHRSHILSSSF
jgi:hypothetical protein